MKLILFFLPLILLAKYYPNQFNIQHKKKFIKKQKSIKINKFLINELNMSLAIYSYDKDAMNILLKKKIPIYQKIEANYKLKRYKQVQKYIFLSPRISSNLYLMYLNTLKKVGNFVYFGMNIQKNVLTNKLKIKNNDYLMEIETINNSSKEILISKKFLNYILGIGCNKSNHSFPILEFIQKGRLFSYTFIYNKNTTFFDKVTKKIYEIRRDILNMKYNYRNYINNVTIFSGDISKNYYNHKTYTQINFQVYNKYNIVNNLDTIFYINHTNYSNVFENFNEIGIGVNFQDSSTYSINPTFFITPLIFYNTKTSLGYNLIVGFYKRIIKADKLSVLINLNSYENSLKINYIYYF